MIDPILFYLAEFADNIKCLCAVGLAVSICFFAASLAIEYLIGIDSENERVRAERTKKISLIALFGFLAPAIILPSKETLMEMLVAKYATAENGKAILEYIVDTVREIGG